MKGDTIAAIATPMGTGGISIVKVSGPEAIAAVTTVFRPKDMRRTLDRLPTQTMVYGHIHDPERRTVLDEVLVTVLKGPHSYTGEDVVEINCHGGMQVSSAVLDLLLVPPVRMADPGEFTRRAFLNGRIDLTQAESIIDLIHARTRRAARMGGRMLAHGVGDRVRELRDRVAAIRVQVEASIDFCEEDDTDLATDRVHGEIRDNLLPAVQALTAGYKEGRLLRQGLRIVLAGKPNVGKSSLMNRLLRQNRVIVTDVPGTTRDTVEEALDIDGVPVLLCDTAGLRAATDPVETIGQEKAREAIDQADLVLMMIDASQPTNAEDDRILEGLRGRPCLLVRNKIDLVHAGDPPRESCRAFEGESIAISALTGEGIDELKRRVFRFAGLEENVATVGCHPNQRQQILLSKAESLLAAVAAATDIGMELVAVDLKDCERYFNQILGIDVEENVLDAIFHQFCIGK